MFFTIPMISNDLVGPASNYISNYLQLLILSPLVQLSPSESSESSDLQLYPIYYIKIPFRVSFPGSSPFLCAGVSPVCRGRGTSWSSGTASGQGPEVGTAKWTPWPWKNR